MSEADSQYQQYTDSMTRSHEYSQIASQSETMSAQTQSNYAQEFVGYVQAQTPERAEAILTDTASPQIRAEREQLAEQFMKDKVHSRVEGDFETNRASLSDGMPNGGHVAAHPSSNAYQQGENEIQSRSDSSAIRTDNSARVDTMIGDTNQSLTSSQLEINTVKDGINSDRKGLSQAHQMAEGKFAKGYGDAVGNNEGSDPRMGKALESIDSAERKLNADK